MSITDQEIEALRMIADDVDGGGAVLIDNVIDQIRLIQKELASTKAALDNTQARMTSIEAIACDLDTAWLTSEGVNEARKRLWNISGMYREGLK